MSFRKHKKITKKEKNRKGFEWLGFGKRVVRLNEFLNIWTGVINKLPLLAYWQP
jgi:hypothetical protein